MKRANLAWLWILVGVAGGVAFVISCDGTESGHAQSSCNGTCTVAGPLDVKGAVDVGTVQQPVKIAGPVKVITADSDLDQLAAGNLDVNLSTATFVVGGPLVLSDFEVTYPGTGVDTTELWVMPNDRGQLCGGGGGRVWRGAGQISVHGARIRVPAGQNLCVQTFASNASVSWAGFKPY
jgi:hypothetical protein